MTLNVSIILIATWVTILKRFSPGELPLSYYICTGTDPNKDQGPGYYQCATKKYNASLGIWIFCTVIHIVLAPKIFLFQRKTEKRVESIKLGIFKQSNQIIPNTHELNSTGSSVERNQRSKPLRYKVATEGSSLIWINLFS